MSRMPTTSAVADEETSTSKESMSLEQKIGMAKKFDREMKDYAKATVKEFLGIYGYEEDVNINMEDSDAKGQTATTSENTSQAEKPPESSTSTDCHNPGDKTHLEMAGPMQAGAVVTIDLEAYDENEVSEISIIEGPSTSESGSSIPNPQFPAVLCLSNEVPCLTETLILESEKSNLMVEAQSQCEVAAQEDFQCELGLLRDTLGSKSRSGICESYSELGAPGETLGSQGELRPLDVIFNLLGIVPRPNKPYVLQREVQSQSETDQSQCELGTLGETLGSQRQEQSQSKVLQSQCELGALGGTLGSYGIVQSQSETCQTQDEVGTLGETSGSHGNVQSQSETCPSQNELGTLNETLGSCASVQSQSEMYQSQNELGTLAKTLQSHGNVQSQSKTCPSQDELETLGETLGSLGIVQYSEVFESQGKLGSLGEILRSRGNVQSQSQVSKLQSDLSESQDELGTLSETLSFGQTMETLEIADGSFNEAVSIVSTRALTPTPTEILDALSQIMPCSQPTSELAVLREHSYATSESPALEANPEQILQDRPSIVLDLPSNYESLDQQHSDDIPADNSTVVFNDGEPLASGSGEESSLNSSVEPSLVKVCGSSGDVDLNSRDEMQLSTSVPVHDSNVECRDVEPSGSSCGEGFSLNSSVEPGLIKVCGSSEDADLSPRDEKQHSDDIPAVHFSGQCGDVEPSASSCGEICSLNSSVELAPIQVCGSSEDADSSSRNEKQHSIDIHHDNSNVECRDIETSASSCGEKSSFIQPDVMKVCDLSKKDDLNSKDEKQHSNDIPADKSNVVCSDGEPLIGAENDSSLDSNVVLIPVKSSCVSEDAGSSSREESNLALKSNNISSANVAPTIRSSQPADISTNTPGLNSNIEVTPKQLPTLLSVGKPSLETIQSEALEVTLTPKLKNQIRVKRNRENETPEKREIRLKLQRERNRVRRSNESEAEREARREKDRTRQQLKRARENMKRKGSGYLPDTPSQTPQSAADVISVEDGGLLNPNSHTLQSSADETSLDDRNLPSLNSLQSSADKMSVKDRGVLEERAIHHSSTLKYGVTAIAEETDTIPSKKAKILPDTGSTDIKIPEYDNGESDFMPLAPEIISLPEQEHLHSPRKTSVLSNEESLPKEHSHLPRDTPLFSDKESLSEENLRPSRNTSMLSSGDGLPEKHPHSSRDTAMLQNKESLSKEHSDSPRDTSKLSPESSLLEENPEATMDTSMLSNEESLLKELSDSPRDTSRLSPDDSLREKPSPRITSMLSPEESLPTARSDSARDVSKLSSGVPEKNLHSPRDTAMLSNEERFPEENLDHSKDASKLSSEDSSPEGNHEPARDAPMLSNKESLPKEHLNSARNTSKLSSEDSSPEGNHEPARDAPMLSNKESLSKEHLNSARNTSKLSSEDSSPEGNHEQARDAPMLSNKESLPKEHLNSARNTSKLSSEGGLPEDEENSEATRNTPNLSQREKSRLHMRKKRAMETPEQRGVRLKAQRERVRKRRANENQTEREIRRVRDRIRQQMRRTSEPEETRSKRLLQQKDAVRHRRGLESPEEKQARRDKDRVRARKSRESKRAGVENW